MQTAPGRPASKWPMAMTVPMYRLRGMMVRAAMAASVGWPWRSFPQTMMRTIAITT